MQKPTTEAGYRAALETLIRTGHRLETQISEAQRTIQIRQGLDPEPLRARPLRIDLPKHIEGLRVQWDHHQRENQRLERELAQLRDQLEVAKPVRTPDPANPFTDRTRSHEQRQMRNDNPDLARKLAKQARALGFGDQIQAQGV